MAELHFGTTLKPTKLELLTGWMGSQRWYTGKAEEPQLTRLTAWRLGDPAGEVGIETLVVRDDSDGSPVTYQVPLTYRGAPVEGLEHALVGTMEHGVLGTRWVYDAPHDPIYATELLRLVRGETTPESSRVADAPENLVAGVPASSWADDLTAGPSRVLSGEQSNTSVIVEATSDGNPRPVIVKVFRMLSAGENPDVVLQSALRTAGCDRVPDVVGSVTAHWPETDWDGEQTAYGHVAFAQEFLPGVQDAWRVASTAVDEGTDFTGPARLLGEATAEVHKTLADVLGTSPTTHETGTAMVEEMRGRFEAAVAEIDELARFAPLVDRVLAEASDVKWPPMQRVHGDYHLGQVIHSPDRGWILLDFEGEPLRTLAERSLPDQWIRDVAGMLRSLDYCGGSWEQDNPGSARPWVEATQVAFLDGYAAVAGVDPRAHGALLTAFELDKAMYEVVYEARNRPDWVSIPLAAIDRLTAGHDDHTGGTR